MAVCTTGIYYDLQALYDACNSDQIFTTAILTTYFFRNGEYSQ